MDRNNRNIFTLVSRIGLITIVFSSFLVSVAILNFEVSDQGIPEVEVPSLHGGSGYDIQPIPKQPLSEKPITYEEARTEFESFTEEQNFDILYSLGVDSTLESNITKAG